MGIQMKGWKEFWLIYQKKKKKSSAKKLESLWKKRLDTKEATAKVSYALDCFIYSLYLRRFPNSQTMWPNLL